MHAFTVALVSQNGAMSPYRARYNGMSMVNNFLSLMSFFPIKISAIVRIMVMYTINDIAAVLK
jgi:hypothetical protein